MSLRYGIVLVLIFWTSVGVAQDTLSLKAIDVIDTAVRRVSASFEQSFDSMNAPQPLTMLNAVDVLEQRAALPMKNYGPGLLATPTFRGGDANHTQVIWNGMKLNSPMLGTMDLSTLPVTAFDNMSLMSGVSSSLYATGGMGSLIAFEQGAELDRDEVRGVIGAGSFSTYQAAIQFNTPVELLNRPAAFAFSADLQASENAFVYTDITMDPWRQEVIDNASFGRSNVSFSMLSRVADYTEVEVITWLSSTQRRIPSTINSPSSYAEQDDAVARAFLNVRHERGRLRIAFRSMYEDNNNGYFSVNREYTLNRYRGLQNQVEGTYRVQTWLKLHGRLGYDLVTASSQFYTREVSADQFSALLVSKWSFLHNTINLDAGGRIEEAFGTVRVLPFGGVNLTPRLMPISVFAAASQTVRFPTLNERFWVPGGREDLETEDGYTLEGGISSDFKHNNIQIVVYQSRYTNRIRWLPQGSFFSPVNIDEARINGVDVTAEQKVVVGNKRLTIGGAYHFTNARGRNTGEELLPLSFVPNHAFALNGSLRSGRWTLQASHRFVGERYVTNDANLYLPNYQIASFGGMYAHPFSDGTSANLSLSVNNAFDWQYQNMPWRPMPGRSIHLKLDVRWAGRG